MKLVKEKNPKVPERLSSGSAHNACCVNSVGVLYPRVFVLVHPGSGDCYYYGTSYSDVSRFYRSLPDFVRVHLELVRYNPDVNYVCSSSKNHK